ncbi:MAG: DUF2064 domain-containing protein [Rhodobacteraceae bacterium]|nr:DUF2064 domain-containing protein [Paracoccaceae bacterium]
MRPALVVMIKQPRPGRVKTRLGRDMGMVSAAWWFRHQTDQLLRRMRDPRWDLVLAVNPDREGMASRVWPADLPRLPQGPGDLGARMKRVFQALPHRPACIIGADIPGIRACHISRAFAQLGQHDAVFGPAPDGGYWLVGVKHAGALPATLFRNIRWSSEHALADSAASFGGRRIALVDTLEDVDTVTDLRNHRRAGGALCP